ncbi:MAG: hypothetical protein IJ946_01470 [Clostridia bacterium]|nr:hypothetical protein [Clostridia bacterium]
MKTLPDKFVSRMQSLLGEEYSLFEQAVNDSPVRGFRVNTDKISIAVFDKINPFGSEKIPYVENGYYLDYQKIGNHPYHHAGIVYVQEPAAMAPAECLDINPDWRILDMCAAPGGKSSQLKNKLGEKGILVSNEIIMNRCKILTGNLERLGLKNCVTTCMDSSFLAASFPNEFDMIMVDAPCSGEGMFRKDDIAIEEWSEENVLKCAERQKEILNNASLCLKDGGYIIYATCTFSLNENEMVVDSFLKEHPDFELLPVNERIAKYTSDGVSFKNCYCNNLKLCRRFYPHKGRGEGQFMALLHSTACVIPESSKRSVTVKENKLAIEFLNDTLTDFDKKSVFVNGQRVYIMSPEYCSDAPAFSCGVTVGEIRKNYILPHHQFFSAFGNTFKRRINLSVNSDALKNYLHGEEFETECENGWAVVMVDGCAVGGVKVSNGMAKNHYPKGLRTF